ncbi:hemerythrin domain-containing protein [Homoserinimonas sp. A447]
MVEGTLESALEREHRAIDGGIEEYSSGDGASDEPLLWSMFGLRRHIYLEERFLFPPLRDAGMMMPVMVMLREHGELWRSMDALDRLLADDAAHATVLTACRELLAQLDKHNTKEEPILYARADAVLSPAATAELSAFIDEGRLPGGWVCEGA